MFRIYERIALDHIKSHDQMLFLVGPRQVGKTTIGKNIASRAVCSAYTNWDNEDDQKLILGGIQSLMNTKGLLKASAEKKILVLDEIHKFKNWRNYVKGIYDQYHDELSIIVTGSSKLDAFKAVGDSLMGRYFSYKIHPLSMAELQERSFDYKEIRPPIRPEKDLLNHLMKFGGFPDPFLKGSEAFHNQWMRLRIEQLFHDEIRSLGRIHDIQSIKLMATLLKDQAGQLINYNSIASKIKVSTDSVIHWIDVLGSFHYCYTMKPWSKNLTRALIKQPKIYLWNWSEVPDLGARFENLIASHLMKAVALWNDIGLGQYGLYFVRDKEQHEVDFLVTRDDEPWFLVEAKLSSSHSLSKSLYLMQRKLGVKHALQVCLDEEFVDKNCFDYEKPVIVSASAFLSQLV